MSLSRKMSCVFLALALGACGGGGGGGGGGGSTGGGAGGLSISFSPQSLTFQATSANDIRPPTQAIVGTLSGAAPGRTLYIVAEISDPRIVTVGPVRVTGDRTGEADVIPALPITLGSGSYPATLTVRACLDSPACPNGPIDGSPRVINVTYNVGGLRTEPSNVTLSSVEGVPSQPSTVTIQNFTSAPITTTVTYGNGAANWLTVSAPSGAAPSQSITLTGAGLVEPGSYTASLVVVAGTFTRTIPVTYEVTTNLRTDPTNIAFTAVTGQSILPAARAVNVTTTLTSTAYTPSVTYGANASGWLSVSGNSAPGVLSVQPNTTGLAPGRSYGATVVLTPTNGGAAYRIPVTYAMEMSQLTLTPTAPTFTIDAASTSASTFTQRRVQTGDTGAALSWTATSDAPWVTVTSSGVSGSDAVLNLVVAELEDIPNGSRNAVITFNYRGPGFLSAQRTISVGLNLDLPTINYVAPYVAYLNEQQEVIVRGSGFSQASVNSVTFDGVAAQTIVIRSDTEIRAIPPAFAANGRRQLHIGNNLGLSRSRAELVVREHPAHTYAAVPTLFSNQNFHAVYDAERDAVLSASTYFNESSAGHANTLSHVSRFSRSGGSWSRTSVHFPFLLDIAMSPDGRELIVLCRDVIHRADPVTLAINSSIPFALEGYDGLVNSSQLAVMNDGKVIIRGLNRTYSLIDGTFDVLPYFGTSIGIDVSLDGSRAVWGAATNEGDVALSYYDASTGAVTVSNAFQYYSPGSLGRSGHRLLSGTFVRDETLELFGRIPWYGLNLMAPDGNTVYSLDWVASLPTLRVFDTRVRTSGDFPELATITVADDPGPSKLLLSLDGRTVFFIGDEQFIVKPLP